MKGINKSVRTITRIGYYLGIRKIGLFLGVLLSFVATGATLYGAYQIKVIVNDFIVIGDWKGMANAVLVLAGIYILGVLASTIQTQVMLRVAYGTLKDIRRDLFRKLQNLPIGYFDTNAHGDVMSRFTSDTDALQISLEQSIIQVVNNVLQIVGSIGLMYILGKKLLIVTLGMTIVMVLATQLLGRYSRKYFINQQNDLGRVNGNIEETISGHETIQAFCQEENMKKIFNDSNEQYRRSSTKALVISGVILPIVNYLNAINFALTAMVGGLMILGGGFDLGSLTSYLQITVNYNQPFKQISMQVNNVLQGLAGAKRIFMVLDENEELDEGNITIEALSENQGEWSWKRQLSNGEIELIPLKGEIEFEHVDFSYTEKNKILQDISLKAQKGEKIAFVGSTGAGKTTVTNLINRFYDIEQGRITYDGIDIKSIRKADLRRALGLVLQDTYLFTGTIMENIRYGKPDATDEEIIEAAKITYADYFISRLSKGYETVLVRNGENLSSGQRQLIAIVRTAIVNPPVLILDEATSSIDTRTEMMVSKGMEALIKGRTVLVIAHRLSTIKDADAIMVMDQGRIIESGPHEHLMEQKGWYYQLNMGIAELV